MSWRTTLINEIKSIAGGDDRWITVIHSACRSSDTGKSGGCVTDIWHQSRTGAASSFITAYPLQLLDKREPSCCFFLIWNEFLYFVGALWIHILCSWLSFLFGFITRMKKTALCLLFAIVDPWLKRQALDLEWRLQQTGTRKYSTIKLRNSYSLLLGQWHLIWEGPKLKVT